MGKYDSHPINGIIMPTEFPVQPIVIKRALLLYDSISVCDPNETHLIPDQAIIDKYPHMEICNSKFAPYPRVRDYEEKTEYIINTCSTLVSKNIIRIVNPDLKKDFPFRILRHAYHWLPSDKGIVEQASKTIEPPSTDNEYFRIQRSLLRDGVYWGMNIVPKGFPGIDEVYPETYNLPATDEERFFYYNSIAQLRIGQIVKYILYCSGTKLIPITTNMSQKGIIETLYQRSYWPDLKLVAYCKDNKIDFTLWHCLENFIFEEIIDPCVLEKFSIDEVLKIRGKTWGSLQRIRGELHHCIKKLRVDLCDARPEEIRLYVVGELSGMLKDYQKAQMNFKDELSGKNISIGAMTGLALAKTVFSLCLSPGWETMVTLATGAVDTIGGFAIDKMVEVWKKNNERKRLPLYSYMQGLPNQLIRSHYERSL